MFNSHHSHVDSVVVAPGASHRKALVHHAWQDVAASERDPIMRVVSMHGRVGDRSPEASAVAGLRARASQAMILSRGPLKAQVQVQEHDRKQHDLHERLAHNPMRNLKIPAQFADSLNGYSLRVNNAGSPQMSRYQHRPLSGFARGNVSSQHSTTPQRPHTAPATERKFHRPSGSARQRSGLVKSPSASNLAEQLNDPPTRLLGASAHAAGLTVRPATPPTSSSGTVLGPTWQRRVRGMTAPGDLSERRAGRSRSIEPMRLHQQPGIAASWSGEAPSITDIVAKDSGRPRMKAPVDCWWDDRQATKMSPSRTGGAFGNFATNQGQHARSSSAGRRKQRTSSFTGLETPSVRSLHPGLRQDARPAMRSGSPQVRDRTGSRSREGSSGRRKRMGSAGDHASFGPDTCSQAAPNNRTPIKQEFGLRMYEVHLTGKGDCVCAEERQMAGTTALQARASSDMSRHAKDNLNGAGCGSGVNDESSVLNMNGFCKDSQEVANTSETPGHTDVAEPDRNSRSCGLQHPLTVKHSMWAASVHAKQSLGKLEAMGCVKSEHQACQSGATTVLSDSCSVPDCWDNLISSGENGMLGTLQESVHSLALDWGITDGWCCSLCDELLDEDCFESDDESCTYSTG